MGGARPAARPPARVQDVQGRRRRPRRLARRRRPLLPAHRRPRRALPRPRARPARRRHPDDLRDAFLRATAPKPVPRVDLDHVAPIRASVTDAVEELLDELPRAGRITFRELTGVAGRAARGGRALPGRARAVQAGPRRPRPGRAASATSTIVWIGGDAADDADGGWMRPLAGDRRLRRMTAPVSDEPAARSRRSLMVADEPVEPQLLAQLLEVPPAAIEELCAELAAELRGRRPRLRAGAGGRRLPLPEPPRPGALRRALRARGPVAPAVGRRARDPGHRRLQAADVAGPRWRPSAASTSTASCARSSSGATSRRWPAIPGPGQAVLYGTTPPVPRAARPRLARRPAAARRSSCPAPTWSRRSSTASPIADERPRRPTAASCADGGDRSGSRRSWPGPGSAAGGCART